MPKASRLAKPFRDAEPLRVAIWFDFLQGKVKFNSMIDEGMLTAGIFAAKCSWR
jgi:hypothetical protein